jgi:signal transduction histidine kinase
LRALQVMYTALMVWVAGALQASSDTRHIVLLFDERPVLPGMAALEAAFTHTLTSNSPDAVELYREAMDLSRFDSSTYELLLRDFLRAKYAGKKIDVVVAVMGPALDFLLKHADIIFPGASIVFCGIDRRELDDQSLPSHIAGVLVKREFTPTLELALRLHPNTQRVVVVAGTSDFDTQVLQDAKTEFRVHESDLAFTYLTALPLHKLLSELSQLPSRTIVLFTTLFQDGAGKPFVPHEVVERISVAANAPVYGFVDQYLGHGIVGGSLYSLSAHGPEAAKLALRLLARSEPSKPLLVEHKTSKAMFDWRQLQRWDISENHLPDGSEIRFRPSTVWERYRWPILLIATALLGQSLLIAGLIYQRRRRQQAETETRQRVVELAHMNRRTVAGEMSASIAHEVNQPLMAILANAETVQDLICQEPIDSGKIREIVKDIIEEDARAGEVIDRIRTLLRKGQSKSEAIDLNWLVNSTLHILNSEFIRRQTNVETALAGDLPAVFGDPVQLQQVLVNLLINAMDAVGSKAPSQRRINISTRVKGKHVEVDIADSGLGIASGDKQRLFEPFFTTKENGLGLGLSICSTIVKAHGGKLSIDNNEQGGATVALSFWTIGTPVPA